MKTDSDSPIPPAANVVPDGCAHSNRTERERLCELTEALQRKVDFAARRAGWTRPPSVEIKHTNAFVETVGWDHAQSETYQARFAAWRIGHNMVSGISIAPRIANGVLAWQLNGKGVGTLTCRADSGHPEAIPEKLMSHRDELIEHQAHIAPTAGERMKEALSEIGMTLDQIPEIVRCIRDVVRLVGSEINQLGPIHFIRSAMECVAWSSAEIENIKEKGCELLQSGSVPVMRSIVECIVWCAKELKAVKETRVLEVIRKTIRDHVAVRRRILMGAPISYVFNRYAFINLRQVAAEHMKFMKRRFLLFLVWHELDRSDLPLEGLYRAYRRNVLDLSALETAAITRMEIRILYRKVNSNINEITVEAAQAFINSVPANSQRHVKKCLSALHNKASSMPEFLVEAKKNPDGKTDEGISKIFGNPWRHVKTKRPKKYPTCALSADHAHAVLVMAFCEFELQFVGIAIEILVGSRPSEASQGFSQKHRERDLLRSIRIEDIYFEGGLWGAGYVVVPSNKTSDGCEGYRQVSLTPVAAAWFAIIIAGFHAADIREGPIWHGTYAGLCEARKRILDALGVTDEIAKKCNVAIEDLGHTCMAHASIGRNSFASHAVFDLVQNKGMSPDVVRGMLGHTKGSRILEDSYLKLTNKSESDKFVYRNMPPMGLKFDPSYSGAKARQIAAKSNKCREVWKRRFGGNPRSLKAHQANAAERRRKMLADPIAGEAHRRNLSDAGKARCAKMSEDERAARGRVLAEGKRRRERLRRWVLGEFWIVGSVKHESHGTR